MRRFLFLALGMGLLLPNAAIAGDIVVRTDLDETYTVKPSSVRVGPSITKQGLVQRRETYAAKERERSESCAKGRLSKKRCDEIYLGDYYYKVLKKGNNSEVVTLGY